MNVTQGEKEANVWAQGRYFILWKPTQSRAGQPGSALLQVDGICCAKSLSCPTLCDPLDCSPPGSSVHGILQARILEWVAMLSSRGIFLTQGSNLGLLRLLLFPYWQVGSLPLAPPGKPRWTVSGAISDPRRVPLSTANATGTPAPQFPTLLTSKTLWFSLFLFRRKRSLSSAFWNVDQRTDRQY